MLFLRENFEKIGSRTTEIGPQGSEATSTGLDLFLSILAYTYPGFRRFERNPGLVATIIGFFGLRSHRRCLHFFYKVLHTPTSLDGTVNRPERMLRFLLLYHLLVQTAGRPFPSYGFDWKNPLLALPDARTPTLDLVV